MGWWRQLVAGTASLLLLVIASAAAVECRHGACRPGNEQCGAADPPAASRPGFHLTDASCGLNDPNGVVFDPVHGVAHVSYQKWIAGPQPRPYRDRVYGHFASKDMVRWARLPVNLWNGLDVSNGNRTGYDNQAIFSGSATAIPGFAPDGKAPGVVHIYPGEDDARGYAGVTIGQAVPARYAEDPLLTNLSKPPYNPIVNGVGVVKGQGDTSGAWQTSHGEWRFRVANQTVFGAASSADVKAGRWYLIGRNFDFPRGSCPSFYPLPRSTSGAEFEAEYSRLNASGSLPSHVTKINPNAMVGTYTEPAPKKMGTFKPTRGFEDLYSCLSFPSRGTNSRCSLPGSGYGQHFDAGQFDASKDNLFPPALHSPSQAWRRINWGWLIYGGLNALSLAREVTFNALLRQLEWAPIEEQAHLRQELLFSSPPGGLTLDPNGDPFSLGLGRFAAGVNGSAIAKGRQCEIMLIFELPSVAASFGIFVLSNNATTGVARKGLRVGLEYTPPGSGSSSGGGDGGGGGSGSGGSSGGGGGGGGGSSRDTTEQQQQQQPWVEAVAVGGAASVPIDAGRAQWQHGWDLSGDEYSVTNSTCNCCGAGGTCAPTYPKTVGLPVDTNCSGDSRYGVCMCMNICLRSRGKCQGWALRPPATDIVVAAATPPPPPSQNGTVMNATDLSMPSSSPVATAISRFRKAPPSLKESRPAAASASRM
jgi:hypothetical protein